MDIHTSLQALLQPISSTAASGQDLSFSHEFDQIAEMRRQDDPTLEQGEWVTTLKVADWPGVVRLCTQLLQDQTKDLRVANWLAEAWSMTDGWPGLARGIALHAELHQRFWDTLYPLPDGGDHEERIGTLVWLLQRLVMLVDTLPIARSRQGQPMTLRDWQQARQAAGHAATGTHDAAADTRPSVDLLLRAARDTPAATWHAQLQALSEAQAALGRWQTVVDGHLGADGPGFTKARDKLAWAHHEMERLAREAGHAPSTATSAATVAATSTALSLASASPGLAHAAAGNDPHLRMDDEPAGGPPRSRAQALQQLREVADYFRRTEPHSPVAYLADKAVKWGDMPLHEWLRQVIKDQGAMAHLQELLGLEPPAGEHGH